jgi:hypothetical protein
VIFFAGKQCLCFQVRDVVFRGGQLFIQIFQQLFPLRGVRFFLCQVNVGLDVPGDGD